MTFGPIFVPAVQSQSHSQFKGQWGGNGAQQQSQSQSQTQFGNDGNQSQSQSQSQFQGHNSVDPAQQQSQSQSQTQFGDHGAQSQAQSQWQQNHGGDAFQAQNQWQQQDQWGNHSSVDHGGLFSGDPSTWDPSPADGGDFHILPVFDHHNGIDFGSDATAILPVHHGLA
ncbi:hypothetical protein H9P43_003992 [Blastocladiella emersonii ATCC 22665]|nr:hypothetical protein H9P43_003992 [Blastocladiella emersonii ATCC 22665]